MDTALALQNGLIFGVYLSAMLTALVIASLRINNEMWLNDYPEDIRAKWGPMSARAKRMQRWVALLMFALIIGLLVLQLVTLVRASGGFSFGEVALSLWTSLMLFNLVDLVLIDWLFLIVLQ